MALSYKRRPVSCLSLGMPRTTFLASPTTGTPTRKKLRCENKPCRPQHRNDDKYSHDLYPFTLDPVAKAQQKGWLGHRSANPLKRFNAQMHQQDCRSNQANWRQLRTDIGNDISNIHGSSLGQGSRTHQGQRETIFELVHKSLSLVGFPST
jgi:hypothetical protein